MTKKTKLELTWPGKEDRPALEPRILIEDSAKSHHAAQRRDGDLFDNMLIKGDNLLALKALEQDYAGKVKCVFIDPPYNTGSAFEHYEDGVEHSIWLSLMRDRLEVIHRLLAPDASLWVTLDDNEAHYFKVMCDEVFGRQNFVANVVWQKKFAPQANVIGISDSHDHVLVYAKARHTWPANLLERTAEADARYKNPDNDPRGPWMSDNFTISLTGGARGAQFAKTGVSSNIYEIETPSGRRLSPSKGRCWGASQERFQQLVDENRIWFGEDGGNVPRIKRFLSEVQQGVVARSWWPRDEVGDNQESKREVAQVNPTDIFGTPKPERLIERILTIATNQGDLVLDSFAGSGTTGAVAHKMGRQWIMVEIGNHADTHIVPRLTKVIDGDDAGGITKAVSWEGGGGFRYFTLAPSLLARDRWGNLVISDAYNPEMLAEAMCKHLGFAYAPSQDEADWWRHGQSSETDFLYVTTQSLTHDALKLLSEAVGPHRTLMICARAFAGAADGFANLTCRKIPATILTKCEWGRDDYSLNVGALPERAEAVPDAGPLFAAGEPDRG